MNSTVIRQADSQRSFVWRVAAPSLAASAALLAIAGLAAVSLFVAQRAADRALNDVADAAKVSADLESALQEVRLRLTEYGAKGDDQVLSRLSDLREESGEFMVLVERYHLTDDGRLIRELRKGLGGLDRELEALLAEASAEERRERAERLVNEILNPNLLARAQLQRQAAGEALELARIRSRELTIWTGWTLLLLGIAGAGAGVLAGFGLARSLRRRLVELSVPIRSAAGSLDAVVGPVELRGGENVEDLEDSLHSLADRVTDVVQRLQAAERESLRNDQLAALGQLAAGLAHELRNPLTAIRTLVEAARSQGAAAQLDGRDLEVVDEELSRLDGTLQAFLDYARPPKLERKSIDVRDVVQRTVQLIRPRAERQSVSIEVSAPDAPLTVSADAEQLRQVLLNLLLNALDAIGVGGRIQVTAASEPERNGVVLRVADDGPGIPEPLLRRLFEPFVSSKPSGTGLGLTICRRIVENHGGTISAENGRGGAVMTVRLPAEPVAGQGKTGGNGENRRTTLEGGRSEWGRASNTLPIDGTNHRMPS